MFYFKYEEILTNNQLKYKLDKLSYGDYVEEYISSIDQASGKKNYIVEANLSKDDILVFIKKQKVTLIEIDKITYDNLKLNSEDYKEKRAMFKHNRNLEIEKTIVFYNNIGYEANESSIFRMNSKIAYYNSKFNRLLGNGYSPAEAYEIYNETIRWKDYENNIREISVNELLEIHSLCVNKLETMMLE